MSSPFLQKTAEYIFEKHQKELPAICIVTPSKRAAVFLTHYFLRFEPDESKHPVHLSIDDFFYQWSKKNPVDDISLPFELYDIHQQLAEEQQTFDEFLSFAELLMSDFNEIDQYLIDAHALFNYLQEVKKIETWNPENKEPTVFQKNYLALFQRLFNYYDELSKRLEAKNLIYQGKAYRIVAENIEQIEPEIPYQKIYFVGFNALTKAEERVIKYLQQANRAALLWDSDTYYMDDIHQEAGLFLRSLKNTFGEPFLWESDHFLSEPKRIHIQGVPKNIGQIKAATGMLRQKENTSGKPAHQNTVIVLANELLLVPLLNHLPEEMEKNNVTMGISLKYSGFYHLFNRLINLHRKRLKKGQMHENSAHYFPLSEEIDFLQHPYFSWLYGAQEIESWIASLKALQQTSVHWKTLAETTEQQDNKHIRQLSMLFQAVDKPLDLLKILSDFTNLLTAFFTTPAKEDMENIFIHAYQEIFDKLHKILSGAQIKVEKIDTLHRIIKQQVTAQKISIIGDPLNGLQIMGLLETRSLDFEHVIILSVNEGILPAGRTSSSLIPPDIRKEFNLPTHTEKDAISAYHFYRLLQRAKQIDLLYNTEVDPIGGNDKSRFIYQILNEIGQKHPNILLTEDFYISKPNLSQHNKAIEIEKSADLMEKIHHILQHKEFSASSLNTYIACPLKFYFQQILNIREADDEVSKDIDISTLGTVVHDCLYQIYQQAGKGEPLSSVWFERFDEAFIHRQMNESFAKNFIGGQILEGKNLLIAKVAETFVEQLLKMEKDISEKHRLTIEGLEERIATTFFMPGFGEIKLKGFIDRIDRLDGVKRIIDYKTGSVNANNELQLEIMSDAIEDAEHTKAFQLLFYVYLYAKKYTDIDAGTISPNIISLKKLQAYAQPLIIKDKGEESWLLSFEKILASIFSGILNPELPFTQTPDINQCSYCDFKAICSR